MISSGSSRFPNFEYHLLGDRLDAFQSTPTHKGLQFFVPQGKRCSLEALPDRQRGHSLKDRIFLKAFLEEVVWNLRAEMVDVVKANIASKPLQYLRQFVV